MMIVRVRQNNSRLARTPSDTLGGHAIHIFVSEIAFCIFVVKNGTILLNSSHLVTNWSIYY